MSKPYVTPNGMTAQEAYDSINRWWFKDKLPRVKILWSRYMLTAKPKMLGQTVGSKKRPAEIHLNPKYKRCKHGLVENLDSRSGPCGTMEYSNKVLSRT